MVLPPKINQLIAPVSWRDHCQGDPGAPIILVEYGDYQCAECRIAHSITTAIQQQLGNQICFVFRHFPQSSIHPEAAHAAEAAEAAASQNKFWEMHTHLLEHQSRLADSDLLEYAIALYLDVNQFLQEMTGDRHVGRIQEDIESGIQSGVVKTPTFFINGLKYNGDEGLEPLLETIVKTHRT